MGRRCCSTWGSRGVGFGSGTILCVLLPGRSEVLCLRGGVESRRRTTLVASWPPLCSAGEFVKRSEVCSSRIYSTSHPAGWFSGSFTGDCFLGESVLLSTGVFLSVFRRLGGLVHGGPFLATSPCGLVWLFGLVGDGGRILAKDLDSGSGGCIGASVLGSTG